MKAIIKTHTEIISVTRGVFHTKVNGKKKLWLGTKRLGKKKKSVKNITHKKIFA